MDNTTVLLERRAILRNKHTAISEDLRHKMREGVYGTTLPSLEHLSEEYDVNIRTIRKSLATLAQARLISIRHGARATIIGKTHLSVGMVCNVGEKFFFEDPYYLPVCRSIIKEIVERGDFFAYQYKKERDRYTHLFHNGASVNALIVFAPRDDWRDDLLRLKLPLMVIGETYEAAAVNYTDSDNLHDTMAGVSRLIAAGHRRIAFAGPLAAMWPTPRLRLEGYRRALAKAGLPFDESLVIGRTGEDVLDRAAAVFRPGKGATAFFGAHAATGRAVLDALKKLYPERKIACVIYAESDRLLSGFGRPYTAIKQPLSQIGEAAIRGLYSIIEGKSREPIHMNLRSELVERNPLT